MVDRTVALAALELLKHGILSIDEQGRVWRHGDRRARGVYKEYAVPKRAENVGGKGYLRVAIWCGGRVRNVAAHRLVWEAAHGEILERLEINHKNGNKQDNCLDNLELVTSSQNSLHAVRTRLRKAAWTVCGKSERVHRGQPLIPEMVLQQATQRLQDGESPMSISQDLGIKVHVVYSLRLRRLGRLPKTLTPEVQNKALQMLSYGISIKQIAKQLHVAPYAVINLHRQAALRDR